MIKKHIFFSLAANNVLKAASIDSQLYSEPSSNKWWLYKKASQMQRAHH